MINLPVMLLSEPLCHVGQTGCEIPEGHIRFWDIVCMQITPTEFMKQLVLPHIMFMCDQVEVAVVCIQSHV
jgi:hypothetical protein